MDFTCIEIKEKEDNIHTFFNLDDNVININGSKDCYLNQKVLVYGINKKKLVYAQGLIKQIKEYSFAHTANTFPGCSGGCIANYNNNCVIGIHRGEIKTGNKIALNAGIFIKDIIRYILNHFNKNQNINKNMNINMNKNLLNNYLQPENQYIQKNFNNQNFINNNIVSTGKVNYYNNNQLINNKNQLQDNYNENLQLNEYIEGHPIHNQQSQPQEQNNIIIKVKISYNKQLFCNYRMLIIIFLNIIILKGSHYFNSIFNY